MQVTFENEDYVTGLLYHNIINPFYVVSYYKITKKYMAKKTLHRKTVPEFLS